jgi:uracil phosphoribosyltransferase
VAIIRSGEAMEQGLRDCCRSIRIGKILVQSDEHTHEAKVLYAKFPVDIAQRKVLLMYPIMSTGNTIIKAVSVLKEHGVKESDIIVLNLFCTPKGTSATLLLSTVPSFPNLLFPPTASTLVMKTFPFMTILTSEVHPVAPNHFGQKYFGTD